MQENKVKSDLRHCRSRLGGAQKPFVKYFSFCFHLFFRSSSEYTFCDLFVLVVIGFFISSWAQLIFWLYQLLLKILKKYQFMALSFFFHIENLSVCLSVCLKSLIFISFNFISCKEIFEKISVKLHNFYAKNANSWSILKVRLLR